MTRANSSPGNNFNNGFKEVSAFGQTSIPEKSFIFTSLADDFSRSVQSTSNKGATSSMATACAFFKQEENNFITSNIAAFEKEGRPADSTSIIKHSTLLIMKLLKLIIFFL